MERNINEILGDKDFSDIIKRVRLNLENTDFEQLAKNSYDTDRVYPENFSNWYPNILDFGKFKHSEIISNQILTFKETRAFERVDNIENVDWDEINQILKPTLDKMKPLKIYSLKNGCFSDKFNFEICMVTKYDLAKKLWELNMDSHTFDTGGYTEIVIREFIPYSYKTSMTIYNGMPLRTEVRAFYNMDKDQIEYMVDYWDYNYCGDKISNLNDKIIFDVFHNKTNIPSENHQVMLTKVMDKIKEDINTLKFNKEFFKGVWSVDFMYDNVTNRIYLIDMARGFRSAYWNIDKLTPETRKELVNGHNK